MQHLRGQTAASPPKTVNPNPEASHLHVNLRQLFVFRAVAQKGSATGASSAVLRSSSTVARTIASLEHSLRTSLFDRGTRGLIVNEFGRAVLARTERISTELSAMMRQVNTGKAAKLPDASPVLATGRQLEIVVSLSEKHNMASVARDYGVTQAAVSASLKDLENRLGESLFHRSPRGISPTELGKIVVFHFRRCLAELRHIGPDIAALQGTVQGLVRVGALPLGRTRILPHSTASVLAEYPFLNLATFESPYDQLLGQLLSGDIDFIFGALRPPVEATELSQHVLFDDCVSIIGRAGHPLASRKTLTMRDLLDAKWILSRTGSPSREILHRCFTDAGFAPPKPCVETGDVPILRGMLLESDMLTAISSEQLRYELDKHDLVVLPIDLSRTRRGIGITVRRGTLPSPGARVLMDEISAQADKMIKEGELLPPRIAANYGIA